jgi:hypothetical protein
VNLKKIFNVNYKLELADEIECNRNCVTYKVVHLLSNRELQQNNRFLEDANCILDQEARGGFDYNRFRCLKTIFKRYLSLLPFITMFGIGNVEKSTLKLMQHFDYVRLQETKCIPMISPGSDPKQFNINDYISAVERTTEKATLKLLRRYGFNGSTKKKSHADDQSLCNINNSVEYWSKKSSYRVSHTLHGQRLTYFTMKIKRKGK